MPPALTPLLGWHWTQLPLAHAGMVAGGMATVPLVPMLRQGCRRRLCVRLGQNLLCSAWMLLGMGVGSLALLQLAAWTGSIPAAPVMQGAMLAGMVWGMAAGVMLAHGRRPAGTVATGGKYHLNHCRTRP